MPDTAIADSAARSTAAAETDKPTGSVADMTLLVGDIVRIAVLLRACARRGLAERFLREMPLHAKAAYMADAQRQARAANTEAHFASRDLPLFVPRNRRRGSVPGVTPKKEKTS